MPARPESVGLSTQRLEHLERFLAEKYVSPGRLPNTLTVVHRRGETVHLRAQGHADIERKKPATEDSIYRIYSMTKPITSVALMMLFEEGKFQLDDPVHRYIPEWRDLAVYQSGFMETFFTKRTNRAMQIVDLLRHTSGLTYGFQQRTNVDAAYRKLNVGTIEKFGTLEMLVQSVAKLPLEFSPGEHWNYSISTDVCGYLVEKISGMPFETFLKKRLFEPLKMVDTDFHVPPEKASRLASCYQMGPGGKLVLQDDAAKSTYLAPPSFVSGGGGLVSTAGDYLRFCRMCLEGGELDGVRILSPKTIALMTANHLPGGKMLADMSVSMFSEAAYSGIGFGLGFAVTMDAPLSLVPGTNGEYFWGGAASTVFWIDPKEDLIVIFLTQFMPSTYYNVRREMRTLVYSAFTA